MHNPSVPDYDVIGIGIGPFNLGLAALLDPCEEVRALFLEEKPTFDWHGGLLLEGTTLQVPFLADLVTLADPTSRYSYLNYLHQRGRLYRFYFLEHFLVPRAEYNDYCRWAAAQLKSCRFGRRVESAALVETAAGPRFKVRARETASGAEEVFHARDLVLGVGTRPHVPEALRPALGRHVFHSSEFRERRPQCRLARSVAVVGAGQSAAEVFQALLAEQPEHGYRLDWLCRSRGFFPMEYSKLGLEHFSPDYARYFYRLPAAQRDATLARQDLLYKGISAKTIAAIYDLLYERTVGGAQPPVSLQALSEVRAITPVTGSGGGGYRLDGWHLEQGRGFTRYADCVVLATGYRHEVPAFLDPLRPRIAWDAQGRYDVAFDYRIALTEPTPNRLYVQNGELHTHGVGAPDLGLGAHRNAVIINGLLGRAAYRVQEANVFQQFGVTGEAYAARREACG
jgi:lysine N6-hydroxylase